MVNLKELFRKRDQILYNKHFRMYLLVFLAIVLGLVILISFKFLFVVVLLLLVSVMLGLILRPFRRMAIGFEVGLLATVAISMTHGIKVGLLVGLAVLTAKLIAEGSLTVYSLVIYPSHILIAIFAGLFAEGNVVTIGMIAVVFHSLFTGVLTYFLLGARISQVMTFVFTNIPFNLFLFYYVAPWLMQVLG